MAGSETPALDRLPPVPIGEKAAVYRKMKNDRFRRSKRLSGIKPNLQFGRRFSVSNSRGGGSRDEK